jgi:DNA polymerase III alpha subunit
MGLAVTYPFYLQLTGQPRSRQFLKYTSDHTDLNIVAITDHDEVKGALEAVQLASKYNLEVITGVRFRQRGHR